MSEATEKDAVMSLGINVAIFYVFYKYCLVSVSSDQSGASKAALHHTPLDLVSLATQIQEVLVLEW